jgi:four helix bundle protein
MASIKSFEEIIAWQKSKKLTLDIYKTVSSLRDISFRNQIERASVSIMNNIAEGFERQTNKEFKNFLYIAKGSSGEVRSMLSLGLDLGYISKDAYNTLCNQTIEISRLISGFIKTL